MNDPLRTTDQEPSVVPPAPDVTIEHTPGPSVVDGLTGTYVPAQDTEPMAGVLERGSQAFAVPGYEIEGELGRGGMGVVYKARHLALKRTVALKMILAGGHAGPGDLARFRIEAEAVARLQHFNIVQVFEVGEAGGHPYCALEFVEGGSLASKLKAGPLPAAEAAKLVETLARAVQLAHSRNVVHRDLKPANILLQKDEGGRMKDKKEADSAFIPHPSSFIPKITDFGLARQLDTDSGETQAGQVMGTPSYMAPEQASGRSHDAGPAADIYALGAILYECLAGRPPFKGTTVVETLDMVRTQEPAPPSRCQANVPLDLETICLKCLRKEPEKRYASAAELADDLLHYQQGEPIQARPVAGVERAVKWVKRNPLLTGAALALLLVTVLGVTGVVWKYLDAEQQKGFAQEKEKKALEEADKARKARDFLVSIFQIAETDVKGSNVTVREILADAEKKIADRFADEPELRADLEKAVAAVKRGIARRVPQAMILEVRGPVRLQSGAGVHRAAVPQVLLYLDDRLTLAMGAQVLLVFLSDLHQERLAPGHEVTIDAGGCEPPGAVLKRDVNVLMTFVPLPKGTFYMGWDGQKKGVKTQINADFEIAVHDVTQGQWQALMGNNPSWFTRQGHGRNAIMDVSDEELKLFPVEQVSWDDAQKFIKKLNEQERGRGYWYRLPTEAEWEYACRGGATSEEECSYHFYFDKPTNALSSERANVNGNIPFGNARKGKFLQRPTRVGAYPPNKLGLCDMHGNVYQWCADALPGSTSRVWRGSCWNYGAANALATERSGGVPTIAVSTIGFRLARTRLSSEIQRPDDKVPDDIAPVPFQNTTAMLLQARTRAGRGQWEKAAQVYAQIIDRPVPDWGEEAFEYAAVLLLAGDQPGYKKICEKLVERCGHPGVRPYHVARACSLAPGSFTPAERPAELAKGELSLNGTAFWSLWLKGALHYRAGRYRDALTLLQKSRDDKSNLPDGVAATGMWLALTYHRLNQANEARREFEQAEKWLAKFPDGLPSAAEMQRQRLHLHNLLELQVLRREVTLILRPGPVKGK